MGEEVGLKLLGNFHRVGHLALSFRALIPVVPARSSLGREGAMDQIDINLHPPSASFHHHYFSETTIVLILDVH